MSGQSIIVTSVSLTLTADTALKLLGLVHLLQYLYKVVSLYHTSFNSQIDFFVFE